MSAVTVRTTTVFRQELGGAGRVVFALLGVVAFVIGLWLLISGVWEGASNDSSSGSGWFAYSFLEWLVILALFVVGILNVVSGFVRAEGESTGLRAARVAIGLVVLVLGVIAIWPVLYQTTIAGITWQTFLWVLVSVALTLEGIFLVLVGLARNVEGWQRGVSIGLGAVVIVFAILSWYSQWFSVFVVWLFVSIALLAFGVRFIVMGASGVRVHQLTVETSR